MYSGPVAAYAYNVARRHQPSALVLVGPSHFAPFRVSIWPDGEWETPLGAVRVDARLAAALVSANTRSSNCLQLTGASTRSKCRCRLSRTSCRMSHRADGDGRERARTASALGAAIAQVVQTFTRRTRCSSRAATSHTTRMRRRPRRLDRRVIEHVERLDPEGLMRALEAEPRHACGGGPMVAVLDAVRRLGATQSRLLQYADSGDVSGDKSSVVGYMAAAMVNRQTRRPASSARPRASRPQVASVSRRSSGDRQVRSRRMSGVARSSRSSTRASCAVVSDGSIHNCRSPVWSPSWHRRWPIPIHAFIPSHHRNSTASTSKFSVLTHEREIRAVEEIEIGRHGLIVEQGSSRGLLLPQVPTEHGWDRDAFLDHIVPEGRTRC